jgi:hypothetical protein
MQKVATAGSHSLQMAADVLIFLLLGCDSIWGLIMALALDFRNPWSIVNALVFVLALPLFLLIFWSRRLAISLLWALFFLRWAVECLNGKPPALCNPIQWPMGVFLLTGLLVLQISYLLGRSGRTRRVNSGSSLSS